MTKFIDSRHRAEQARMLYGTGATWQEIADQVGYKSRQAAQLAVKRLIAQTPAESLESARAKHDTALQLLQRNSFTRYMLAMQAGDDETALRYSKEIRSTVTERAKLAGAYAPVRTEVDVRVEQSAAAILDRAEAELLALAQSPRAVLPVIDADADEVLDVEESA